MSEGPPLAPVAPDPAPPAPDGGGPVEDSIDFYISYRELDSYGYTDKDMASRLAGALQKEKRSDGSPVSVFAPDGESWEVRLKYGLKPSNNILLIVSEDGLRKIRDADRCEDVTLLEYEYALAEKLKSKKKVMLLLLKDKSGANFSAFSTDVYPDGEVSKLCMTPCHKSKRSAPLWDGGAKKDLLIPDNKPGEHSIRMCMNELFRLSGVNVSMKSADIKQVIPVIVAMLRLKLPDIPTERQELVKNERVDQALDKLTVMLTKLGPELLEAKPILRSKFGIGSVGDLAGLKSANLGEPMEIDQGKIVICDQKTLQTILVDNGVDLVSNDLQRATIFKFKVLGLDQFIPNIQAGETLNSTVEISGLASRSTVPVVGKTIVIGGEKRQIISASFALVLKGEPDPEKGLCSYVEMTDELYTKLKLQKEKGGVPETPEGRPCLYGKYILDEPLSRDNPQCEKEKLKDRTNSKESTDYIVQGTLSPVKILDLQKATQTALGASPGEVSLAQTYGNLFEHRIKSAEDVGELNHSLMDAIKAQDAKVVDDLLRKGASANFKDAAGWTPLHRACSAHVDTGDLGMNFIACNQVIEVLIKGGADVSQTNSYGRTALHYAAMEGNFYAASVLVHSGANVDAKDDVTVPVPGGGGVMKGATAAFHATLMKKNEWQKVVQLLSLYTNEAPPPKAEKPAKGKKGKGKKKK